MTTQEQNRVESMLAHTPPSDEYLRRFQNNFSQLISRSPGSLASDISRLPKTSRAFWLTNSAEIRERESGSDPEVVHIILAGYLAGLFTQTGTTIPDPLK